MKVFPLHGQVEIANPGVRDSPQWQTGLEKVVALPEVVAVATRGDSEGDVVIEVWAEELDREMDVELVYEGDLLLAGDQAVVGNVEANDLHQVQLKNGRHHLQVFVAPLGARPDSVYFLLVD